MKVYFLRHAEAVDGWDDAARALSERGWEQARALGRFLKRAGIGFDAVFSSPLVRARETAEGLLAAIGGGSEIQLVDALLNETELPEFEGWMRCLPEAGHVLLVGHNPSLSERAAAFVGLTGDFELPKGGLVCARTTDRRRGTLKFFVTPKLLRSRGKD